MKLINASRMAATAMLLLGLGVSRAVLAQDAPPPAASTPSTPVLRVLRPVPNAVVRETVPVRVAPSDLPPDGYIGVTVDGVFRTARVLPADKTGLIYEWDTKAPYTTTDAPDTQKFIADGDHTLKLDMFDRGGALLGEAIIPVRVANKIIVPAQGIKLAYLWKADQDLHYLHQTELNYLGGGAPGAGSAEQNLQASLVHFSRSVEDATGGDYLVRDSILPESYVIDHGQTQAVQSAYNIKSLYRTVDTRGDVLSNMAALSPGQHIGFSIPVLSSRAVAVGDSWQAPIEMTLSWAPFAPAKVTAESRLEGFEWQNGYPTAKIRETYTGPVTFRSADGSVAQSAAATSASTPGAATPPGAAMPGAAMPGAATPGNPLLGTFQNIRYERVIYFAYNSGRLVRTETTVDFNANLGPDQIAALGIGSSAAPTDNSSPPPPGMAFNPYAGQNNGPLPAVPGANPYAGQNNGPLPDANGNLPGDPGYQGGGFQPQQNFYQPQTPALQNTPVHLKFIGVTTLLT